MRHIAKFNINKVSLEPKHQVPSVAKKVDETAIEEPLEVWIKYTDSDDVTGAVQYQSELLITTMRTPGSDIELVRGWLHSTFAFSPEDILSISATGTSRLKGLEGNQVIVTLKPGVEFNLAGRQRIDYANSSCGICGQQSIEHMMEKIPVINDSHRIQLTAKIICQLPNILRDQQIMFSRTGGIHAAALVDQDGKLNDLYEDVGRHNAVDKLIGHNLPRLPGKYALLLSGRVSFELVQKAALAGISMIIAVGAPTSLAVESCIECDISLIGFVKDSGFNIYSRPNQVSGI